MTTRDESTRLAQDIERWLESPWRRALLAALVTLAAAAATTAQVSEALDFRGREYDAGVLYLQQLCVWAPWGLLAGPLVYLARWIFRWRRSWVVAAAIQLPLSLVVAKLLQLYQELLKSVVFADDWLTLTRSQSVAWFRFTREFLVYWLVLSIGAAVYSFLKSQRDERRAAELALREAELKGEIAQARLDTLRTQLHPHFLFNALHTVGGLVREGDSRRALEVLSSIAQLLRTSLDQGDAHESRLEDEIALAGRYVEIERVRFGERLRVEFDVAPAADSALVPALCLITLVENAVRHGISTLVAGGLVRVSARVSGATLALAVEDDGPGFPAAVLAAGGRERDEHGAHIGLANTRRRLALLYGDVFSLRLEQRSEGGARVVIEIPYHVETRQPADVRRG